MERYLHTGLVADPVCKLHETGPGHPECADRYDAVFTGLARAGLLDLMEKVPCRLAVEADLELCHARDYIRLAATEVDAGASVLSTGDTAVCRRSMDAALYAVGGVLNAVDAVVDGRVKNAFCAVRPPGHHASRDRGMGFCLFNNAALAARHAQQRHRLARVLIADWDVHHGNGTQDIFYDDDSVFFFSCHQWPWYPGTGAAEEVGEGPGKGYTMNAPLPAGSGMREISAVLQQRLLPAMDTFRPELVVLSAGFDSRIGDPLGDFTLSDDDFADLTATLLHIAKKHAGGRLLSILEGGYDLGGLASGAAAHVRALVDA